MFRTSQKISAREFWPFHIRTLINAIYLLFLLLPHIWDMLLHLLGLRISMFTWLRVWNIWFNQRVILFSQKLNDLVQCAFLPQEWVREEECPSDERMEEWENKIDGGDNEGGGELHFQNGTDLIMKLLLWQIFIREYLTEMKKAGGLCK